MFFLQKLANTFSDFCRFDDVAGDVITKIHFVEDGGDDVAVDEVVIFEGAEFDAENRLDFRDVFGDVFELWILCGEEGEVFAVEVLSGVLKVAFEIHVEALDRWEVAKLLRLSERAAGSDKFWWNAEGVQSTGKGNGPWKRHFSHTS